MTEGMFVWERKREDRKGGLEKGEGEEKSKSES